MFQRSQHFFAQVPQADIPRSSFNRRSGHKTTFNAGWLVPFYIDEVLPADTFNVKATGFVRLATPIKPVMDNIYLDTHFFFGPLRLLWSNFQKFMGEQLNPGDSTSFLTPVIASPVTGYVPPANWSSPTNPELCSALSDYFGLPTRVAAIYNHAAFWHRAYNLIYREWYRDENLQNSPVINVGDGPDLYTDYPLRRRGKRHDYFTSALPWPQKGSSVNLPLGTLAPVIGLGTPNQVFAQSNVTVHETGSATTTVYANARTVNPAAPDNILYVKGTAAAGGKPAIYADLTAATAATINQLRQAFQIQRLYERDARGGTRYTEILHSHFGVISPDARLQRPEYLGGGSSYINFTPIAQNSATVSGQSPQGNLSAMATGMFQGHGFVKSFVEHGVIIGIMSARADMTYQNGLHKMFQRQTRLDYYWPVLSHIGEQAILNNEIYCQGNSSDTQVFGYQERHAEYRYKPSIVTGRFRSNDPIPLDTWHLAQKFASLPVLGSTFIEENPPIERVIAVTTEPHFLADILIENNTVRPMPVYSVPGQIDHF